MITQRDAFIKALEKRGWARIPHPSRKYVVFSNSGFEHYMYVGKMGALRRGTTIAGSIPVSSKFKDQLLLEGRS